MKSFNSKQRVAIRRKSALERLQKQLESGVKQPKGTLLAMDLVPLTDSDKERIQKEINTLKSRV